MSRAAVKLKSSKDSIKLKPKEYTSSYVLKESSKNSRKRVFAGDYSEQILLRFLL